MSTTGLSTHEIFGALHAEAEPWLLSCYVPPAYPTAFNFTRSSIMVGEKGSGKSAFLAWAAQEAERQGYLPLMWHWDPFAWMMESALEVQHTLLESLLQEIARLAFIKVRLDEVRWSGLTPGVQKWLQAFWSRYLISPQPWLITLPAEQQELAQTSLEQIKAAPSWSKALSPTAEAAYIISLLRQAGYQGVVVLFDDIVPSLTLDPRLKELFADFLSTLVVFDVQGLTFKIVVDAELSPIVEQSPVITRRRADLSRLQWSMPALESIVTRRLKLVFDDENALERFYKKPALLRWLARLGGDTPRGWLATLAPLLFEHEQICEHTREVRPFTQEEWRSFCKRHLPPMAYDDKTATVTLGSYKVTLSQGENALFGYLWERRGKLCGRDELYKAYVNALYEFTPQEKILQSDTRGILDTALYRLREALEPDPDAPIFIITQRGKGVRLEL